MLSSNTTCGDLTDEEMDDADDKTKRKFDAAMEVDYEDEEVSPKKIAKKAKAVGENAGNPAVVVDKTNDNVTLDNANSVELQETLDEERQYIHEAIEEAQTPP
jgi:hypothetical protein